MTQNPKEKAKELVYKYEYLVQTWDCYNDEPLGLESKLPQMKQCALIAVEEMLEFTKITEKSTLTICTPDDCFCEETTYYNDYLIEVKSEIEKL
jgi:hypothetical protein